MAFPLTHLLVADEISKTDPDPGLFLLGSIAPDAIHYRPKYKNWSSKGFSKNGIGPAKKITHLCPISDEKWGYITDNNGWAQQVKNFLNQNPNSPQHKGYAAHILTDILNNQTIWTTFRKNHPKEAAKGYSGRYYDELKNIDLKLYHEYYKNSRIPELLKDTTAKDMPNLVAAEEIHAIRDNILYVQYKDAPPPSQMDYLYVNFDEVLDFIQEAARYVYTFPEELCIIK